jgi:hypothetical protein
MPILGSIVGPLRVAIIGASIAASHSGILGNAAM